MPLPDLRDFCIDVDVVPGEVCISFPGGAEICATLPDIVPPQPDKFMRALFGQVNAALAPLQPIFNIIDAVVAVFECVKAISTLDPVEILNCIPNLADKVAKLLNLIPQLSLVALIAGLLEVVIYYLRGTKNQILRAIELLTRLLDAETAATRPGNIALARVLPCALDDLDKLLQWQNEGNKPINRLIGVINLFLEVIGLERFKIPCIGSLLADLDALEAALSLIDLLIELLEIIRLAIPIPPSPFFFDPASGVGGPATTC
jgi:hypothetical protein